MFIGGSSDPGRRGAAGRGRQDDFRPDAGFGPARPQRGQHPAAAAVIAAAQHLPLAGRRGAGVGGHRAGRFPGGSAAGRSRSPRPRASRNRRRAKAVCSAIAQHVPQAQLRALAIDSGEALAEALEGVTLVIAAARRAWSYCRPMPAKRLPA